MGTGIGEDCKICGKQLNYEDGFDSVEKICDECLRFKKRLDYFNWEDVE